MEANEVEPGTRDEDIGTAVKPSLAQARRCIPAPVAPSMARVSPNCKDSLDLRFQLSLRRHHDVCDADLILALESQYDTAGTVELEPLPCTTLRQWRT